MHNALSSDFKKWNHCTVYHKSLTLFFFSILVYPFVTKGKDGHSSAVQIVSG